MSDADNEKNVTTEDDTEESFSRLPLVKTRSSRKDASALRHPRQKFCVRWEKDFPWLRADNMDEAVGICTVCNKHLVCKKSHLERHQRSYKHQRQQGFEALETKGDLTQPNATEFLECGIRKPEDDVEFGHAIDPDYTPEFELKAKRIKQEPKVKTSTLGPMTRRSANNLKTMNSRNASSHKSEGKRSRLDRFKLLKRIDRDRNELNEYYYARRRTISPGPVLAKDSFDLFFESVSASVKTLPPKLAAEVKGRVSQLIAEFELRAICEREALESSQAAAATIATPETANVVVTNAAFDATPAVTQESASIDPATGVPHIVYTFQPK